MYLKITHPWQVEVGCFEVKRSSLPSVCFLVPQFDLVCVNAWMLDLTQAILNLGFLAGAFTLGYAADR